MRILFIRPCCIGDVVVATAALSALRDHYPDAHITWAVGGWSRRAVDYHPALNAVLDTGTAALPVKSVRGFWRFVRQIRSGNYDLAVSLVRSPLMSAALLLSGIPQRAGINSNGRGFGYNLRAPVNPSESRHEAEIYLDVVRLLGAKTEGYQVNLPVQPEADTLMQTMLTEANVTTPYIVINPAGGSNPGMLLDSKRWLPQNFAQVANVLAQDYHAKIILLAGPDDEPIIQAVQQGLDTAALALVGVLTFPQIGALAAKSMLYIGNDTGLTHLAAASGAKTVMILGPSDPVRYAPYTPNSLALWKPIPLAAGGVADADNQAWDWARDGITVAEALPKIRGFIEQS